MKLKFSNEEYRMISDVTPITDRPAANRGSSMMKASRNIRTKLCSMAVLITFAAVMLAICILPASALTCDCDICVNETGWWCDNGTLNSSSIPIQAGVNAANSGETIYVYNGSYTENVNVNKRVTLQGEGADVVTVSAASASDPVFEVIKNYVNISGFNVTGVTSSMKAGIYLYSTDHCNISNNNASNNSRGIYLNESSNNMLTNNTASDNDFGIYLGSSSNNNMLMNNNASGIYLGICLIYSSNIIANSNNYGIYLNESSNNTLTNNTANSNNCCGICLYSSSNNILTSNTVSSNDYGIYLYSSSNYNTLTNNNASGIDLGIYLDELRNLTANSNNYGICLNESSNNTLTNNTANSNRCYGITLYSSSSNTFTNNIANSNNYKGIYLNESSNNTLTNNTVSSNIGSGIGLYYSSSNTLTNNIANSNIHRGIYLYSSSSNTLTKNTANSNSYLGINLASSSNNTLTNNIANSNTPYGIYLGSSSNNMLTNNTASGNDYGIFVFSSSNNMLANNIMNSNSNRGIYLYFASYNTLTNNTAMGNDYGIHLDSSSSNTFTNNTAMGNDYGIHLYYSSSNTFTSNTANLNTHRGIFVFSSSNNTLTNNTALDNYIGICLWHSSSNTIYNNHFNNAYNAHDAYDNGSNIWNTTPTPGTNIIGGSWLGGNYWSDYSGADTTGDGLGDTLIPYNSSGNISNGGDHHPLVQSVPSPDTTSPVVTNITNSKPRTDSITIIWNTDENSNSLVKYGTVQSNYTDAVLDTVMVSAHNITLSGLTTNTTYYFVVNSTDASNNSAQSEEFNFTTATTITPSFTTVSIENVTLAPGESTTVPIMVNNADDLGGCKINITYDASIVHVTGVLQGDMDYLTYNIDNGTGWMTANALNDSGLNGNAVFANIKLNAVGIKGEETLLDITVDQLIDTGFNPIDHTVIDGIFIIEADTEAPLVINTSASPDTILNDNGRHRAPGTNTTTLSVMVTDADSGVANVTIDLSSIGGSADELMIRVGDTDVRTVTVNAVAGINLTHHLTVNATDNKGNFNDSVSITLTVLRRGDVCRNNIIDSNDVIYIARYLAGLEPECSNPPSVLVADVVGLSGDAKGDSIVDLMDALYLARYTAGLEGEP